MGDLGKGEGRREKREGKRGGANVCPRERERVRSWVVDDPVDFRVDGSDERFPVAVGGGIEEGVDEFGGQFEGGHHRDKCFLPCVWLFFST